MRGIRAGTAVLAVLVGGLVSVGGPMPARASEPTWVDACPAPGPGFARCFAQIAGDSDVGTLAFEPVGYSPAQIKKAYGFSTKLTAGKGRTVAVVSAFDAPDVEADLNVFSAEYGLPPCTTANGCFKKVFARGELPPSDVGWALETTLDVEWVHAIAPGAKIILVEASSNSFVDLMQAFQVATQSGAKYVTNSWGGPEFEQQTIFEPLFGVAGISEFFSSGDTGGVVSFPASSPQVIAVGGTRLILTDAGYRKTETAWTHGGSGCSSYYSANPAQASFAQYPATCAGARATPDFAATADPNAGASIYYSSDGAPNGGWSTVGGTSLSSPIMAARAALTGQVWDAAHAYSANRTFFDIRFGNNGFPAGPGYDLATGRGRFRS